MKSLGGKKSGPFSSNTLETSHLGGRRVFMALLVVLLAAVLGLRQHLDRKAEQAHIDAAKEQWAKPGDWQDYTVVEIEGMVHHPGVYKLNETQKLGELLLLARAYALEGQQLPTQWNEVPLETGVCVKIAWSDEGPYFELGQMDPQKRLLFGMTFDANSATTKELEAIPSIGPSLAQSIVDYRGDNGDFTQWKDFKSVRGIGDKKLEQLQKYLTLNTVQDLSTP